MKGCIYQFEYCFGIAEPKTAETWLQNYADCWNKLI